MPIAYKLFRKDNAGHLHPLYVNAKQIIPMGVWLNAESGERMANGKVKASLGGSLKYRPGWHLSDIPLAPHIGVMAGGKIAYQHPDTVWCEVLYHADINYMPEAQRNGYKSGKFVPKDADLDHIPKHGYYRYKTNPRMIGDWIIAGEMLVLHELTQSEVDAVCRNAGYEPQMTYERYHARKEIA